MLTDNIPQFSQLCPNHHRQDKLLIHYEWGGGNPPGPGVQPPNMAVLGVGRWWVVMLMIILCYWPPITAL